MGRCISFVAFLRIWMMPSIGPRGEFLNSTQQPQASGGLPFVTFDSLRSLSAGKLRACFSCLATSKGLPQPPPLGTARLCPYTPRFRRRGALCRVRRQKKGAFQAPGGPTFPRTIPVALEMFMSLDLCVVYKRECLTDKRGKVPPHSPNWPSRMRELYPVGASFCWRTPEWGIHTRGAYQERITSPPPGRSAQGAGWVISRA